MKNIETTIEMRIYMTGAWNKHMPIFLKKFKKETTLLYRRRYQNQSYHPLPINHPRGDFICWNGGSPPAGKETQQSTFGLKQVELSGGNLNVYPITKGAYIDTIN